MIDRGALVLSIDRRHAYRGVYRPALDAVALGRRLAPLQARYRRALVEGDTVIDDLDVATQLAREARAAGLDVEVVVFEAPQERAPQRGALPLAPTPPDEGLILAGYDVIELLEPWCSTLITRGSPLALNAFGLLDRRRDAENLAAEQNARDDAEDPVHAVRVWLAAP